MVCNLTDDGVGCDVRLCEIVGDAVKFCDSSSALLRFVVALVGNIEGISLCWEPDDEGLGVGCDVGLCELVGNAMVEALVGNIEGAPLFRVP